MIKLVPLDLCLNCCLLTVEMVILGVLLSGLGELFIRGGVLDYVFVGVIVLDVRCVCCLVWVFDFVLLHFVMLGIQLLLISLLGYFCWMFCVICLLIELRIDY